MASQLRKITANRRLTSDPYAVLNAKIAMLPQRMANQQEREVIARDTAFQNKQISLTEAQMKQRKREQQAAMGLEATKLGYNLATGDLTDTSVGDLIKGGKDTFKASDQATGTSAPPPSGGFYDVKPAVSIASGITGYGVGNLIGGSKKKQALYGALAGGLMGLLGGKGNLASGGMGALLGGIGGYL